MHWSLTHPGTVGAEARAADHAHQAYQILHWGYVAAPLIAGVDKFFHILTDWEMYLATPIANLAGQVGLSGRGFMLGVGVIEILAALLVAVKPRIGAYVVAAWLMGIIINLLLVGGFYDIALRDFGLCLGALALARLSQTFEAHKPPA